MSGLRRPFLLNTMTDERALQISNNVSEEFVDLGDVSFATKKELCETILWLNGHHLQDLQRKDQALDDILVRAAQTNLLVHVSPRPYRAFQGWRYLQPKDAPPDLDAVGAGAAEMPEEMRRALGELGLL